MFGHRLLLRLCLVVGMLALLVMVPAAQTLAGTSKATAALVALPGSVTLTDDSVPPAVQRFGVLKVTLTTQNSATHVVLNVAIATTASANSIAFGQANLPGGSSGCVTTGPFSLKCSLANAASNSTQATFIRYQTPAASTCSTSPCSLTATATFSFSEGSNDQSTGPNGMRNDTVTAPPSTQLLYRAADVARAGGDCGAAFTLGAQATATSNQATQLVVSGLPSPVAGTPFPCAPADVGVKALTQKFNTPLGFTDAWTLTIPTAPQMATATLYIFKLPSSNANKFQLQEYLPGSTDPNGFFAVPPCNADGTIPISKLPGITYDTCVVDKHQFGSGGVQVTVHTQPTGDPSFGG